MTNLKRALVFCCLLVSSTIGVALPLSNSEINVNATEHNVSLRNQTLNTTWYTPSIIDANDEDDGFGLTIRGHWAPGEDRSYLDVKVFDKESDDWEILEIQEYFPTRENFNQRVADADYDVIITFLDLHESGLGLLVTVKGVAYGVRINKFKVFEALSVGTTAHQDVEVA